MVKLCGDAAESPQALRGRFPRVPVGVVPLGGPARGALVDLITEERSHWSSPDCPEALRTGQLRGVMMKGWRCSGPSCVGGVVRCRFEISRNWRTAGSPISPTLSTAAASRAQQWR